MLLSSKLTSPQSAFCSQHSTETALLKVTNDLLLTSDSGFLTIFLLDFTAAMDTFNCSILLCPKVSTMDQCLDLSCLSSTFSPLVISFTNSLHFHCYADSIQAYTPPKSITAATHSSLTQAASLKLDSECQPSSSISIATKRHENIQPQIPHRCHPKLLPPFFHLLTSKTLESFLTAASPLNNKAITSPSSLLVSAHYPPSLPPKLSNMHASPPE